MFRGAVVYGAGVQNYFNDAPVDIGIKNNPGNLTTPIEGVALPILGISAFLDHTWSEKFSTAIGYSLVDIENSDGQNADAFQKGNYIVGNLMYYPAKNVMAGVELQWGDRHNYNDGWSTSITKVQFTAKYNFSQTFYKN